MTLVAWNTIVRPVVSEKSTVLGEDGKYIFEVAPDANDATGERAALFSIPCRDELLVIDAMHPAGEKTARKRHLQLIAIA